LHAAYKRYETSARRSTKRWRAISLADSSPSKSAFFDAATITFLRGALDDAWAHLPPGSTAVSRSLLAERILKAAKAGERDPAKLRARAITEGIEAGL
jgi:hypothetical protein